MNKKALKQKVDEFLKDKTKKKITLEVPPDFSIYWIRNPLSAWFRKLALLILSKVPPMHFKTWLFRLMGYDFRRDVCLPGFIYIDEYFPELIRLDKGVLVGGMTTIKPWSLKNNKLTLGRIHIARRTLLGGWAKVGPGVTIYEHVIAGIEAEITRDVPKDSFVVGNDRVLKTWTKEEIERHFGESTHDPKFGKKVRQLTKKFRKNKGLRTIHFRNNGNRLNAGCEWWRARPVWRIYYNGIFVESSLLMPFESIRKLLYKLMGVKFGKNVKLGKRVSFDHIYGDMVKVGNNVIIEDDVFFDGHEYTTTETVYGKTLVKDNAHLKKGCYIREGLIIGKNAVIEEKAVVMKDINDNEIFYEDGSIDHSEASREEQPHNWASPSQYIRRVSEIEGKSFVRGVKGLWYLALALADITPKGHENPYNKIDRGASTIYLSGYLSVPRSIDTFERHSGLSVAYTATTDVNELDRIIDYAVSKHGWVNVIGFSDGGKLIENYINAHGDSKVSHFYAIATNPVRAVTNKVTHIVGDRDMLAPMESEYRSTGINYKTVYGGHTFMFSDKRTIGEIADIINPVTIASLYNPSSASFSFNLKPANDNAPFSMRKAA